MMLKPFLPQLQTTFIKAINDPNRTVRLRAAAALGKLILIHTRVDPLFNELISGFKNAEDTSVKWVLAPYSCIFFLSNLNLPEKYRDYEGVLTKLS